MIIVGRRKGGKARKEKKVEKGLRESKDYDQANLVSINERDKRP